MDPGTIIFWIVAIPAALALFAVWVFIGLIVAAIDMADEGPVTPRGALSEAAYFLATLALVVMCWAWNKVHWWHIRRMQRKAGLRSFTPHPNSHW
jgi:hypothetical protein